MDTLCARFQDTVTRMGDAPALRTKGDRIAWSWREYGARVRRAAGGLAALGVRPGDTVAILLLNRPEFNVVDAAAMHLGAVPFSIYPTSSPEQVRFLVEDSGAKLVITEKALRPLAPRADLLVEDLDALDGPLDFDAAWRAVSPESLLTIIYTSGTTGAPKGVELTHANMIFQIRAFQAVRGIHDGSRVISYLPHAHIADRMSTHYLTMTTGASVTACPDPRTLFELVPDVRPTEFTGVPRVWEKLKAGLEAKLPAAPIEAGLQRVRLEQAGQPIPDALAAACARAEELVFAPTRQAIGFGDTRSYFVGAAPTPRVVLEFFHAIGVPIAEVWGMSELSCVATAMPIGLPRIGTVGKVLPGVELAIAADGEVLVRGPLVMRGYRNQPAQTAEAIDADGWLHTGDVGALDADGFLAIVDRKKEIIINAAGKNMSPANIEAQLKTSSALIGQACVIGDGRPYVVALVVLDPDGMRARGLDAASPEVQVEVERAVAAANARLSRVEQVKRFRILADEWLPGGDELTPTMKLRRKPIAKKYAAEIEALYA